MGALTAKTIRPVKSGVGYAINDTPQAAEFAQIDQQLATYGLNSVAADTVTGTLSIQTDPLHTSTPATLTGNFNVTASGAIAGTVPGGGTIGVYNGSYPTYSAARPRRIRMSLLELTRSEPTGSPLAAGNIPVIDPATGGVTQTPVGALIATQGFATAGAAQITIPMTKTHDGATIASVVLYFYWPVLPNTVHTLTGKFALQKVTVATNALTSIGNVTFPTSASTSAPAGTPHPVSISGLSEVIDLSTYVYRFLIQDPAVNGSNETPGPIYTGIEINLTTIGDERFTQ